MQNNPNDFINLVKHPIKFPLFLLAKLPSAFFSGVRVRGISGDAATVSVPFKWFSQNPFNSTYFACLAMAAEMSTGLLAMMHTYKNKPAVSMLVIGLEARYHKKATGRTHFVCNDGAAIASTIAAAVANGQGQSIRTTSTGTSENDELVAEFFITWSFKAKL
jgi:hypothetical protein